MIVFFNGEYIDKADAHVSVDDRGFLFGDGVYEVVRSYRGHPFQEVEHLDRMARGMAELRIDGFDARGFSEVVPELLARNALEASDAVVYMQVTRGAAARRHAFPDSGTPPTVYATAAPVVPRGDPDRGVGVVTHPDYRWTRCDIKSVNLLANCLANQYARERGAVEAILIRDGIALEATASSFFGVFDGVVRTAPRSTYILPSITRQVVLELCGDAGVPVEQFPILQHDLGRADELFLAGTTVEVMPIVHVDGTPVGDGTPGPVTARLADLFRARTRAAASVG